MESKPDYLLGAIPFYKKEIHPAFTLPVSKQEVEDVLLSMPSEYIEGIQGIRVLAGSAKQLKIWNRWQMFGEYAYGFISLYPFPKNQMKIRLKKLPAPHKQREYLRVGVEYKNIKKKWYRIFSEKALKCFYLKDVLVHEIGHHVDRFNRHKSYYQKEKFAEAFTDFYGFKNKSKHGNSRFHKTQ